MRKSRGVATISNHVDVYESLGFTVGIKRVLESGIIISTLDSYYESRDYKPLFGRQESQGSIQESQNIPKIPESPLTSILKELILFTKFERIIITSGLWLRPKQRLGFT